MKTYLVGNWKMNFNIGESSVYLHQILKQLRNFSDLELIIAPSTLALQPLALQLSRRRVRLAAQNFYFKDFGAYTGETSISQLRGLVDYALVGHSERRFLFKETDKDIRQKTAAALRHNISPILCIGETADQRTFGETTDTIRDQLLGGLSDVSSEQLSKVLIAYEPVWAISSTSTPKIATPEQVSEVIEIIRKELKALYGASATKNIPILFGGSVNPVNAGAYLTIPGVNGLLVGGSSLILDQFIDIIEVAKRVHSW